MTDTRATILDAPIGCVIPEANRSTGIQPLPGRVLVRMAKHPESQGGVLLSDREAKICDVGVVCESGVDELAPGDVVLVRPFTGQWMDIDGDTYRLFGCGSNQSQNAPDPWYWSIAAKVHRSTQGYWQGMSVSDWFFVREAEDEGPILTVKPQSWEYGGQVFGVSGHLDPQFKSPEAHGFKTLYPKGPGLDGCILCLAI